MRTKPKYRMNAHYDREVYMSEYTPINKEHYRRLRTCAIFSAGLNIFLLLVMVLR